MEVWELIAGLSLFLFGMKQLESALKSMSGRKFKQFIRHSTSHPIKSVASGIFATTIVQSSSLVGLVVLAFVGAGVLPLMNAIAVVLGSNLGTTFTGWIVATFGFKMNLSALVYPLLGIGGLGFALTKNKIKSISLFVLALGLLLMGLDLMKNSVHGFSSNINLEVLVGLPLIVYLLFGVIVTAIVQSSSAVMMLTLTALYADLLSLPAAASIVIGADLGTSSTVLLGSIKGSIAQKRLAVAQVIFNLVVDVVAFIAIDYLLILINIFGILDPLVGLVAFHSLFNLMGLFIFIPFITQYSQFMEKIVKQDKTQKLTLIYVDSVPANITDTALEALNLETKRLMSLVLILNLKVLGIENNVIHRIDKPVAFENQTNIELYKAIKQLEGEIITYALNIQNQAQLNLESLTAQQIDHYMKSIRESISAAKSLKDIQQNLEAFEQVENESLIELFSEIINLSLIHI